MVDIIRLNLIVNKIFSDIEKYFLLLTSNIRIFSLNYGVNMRKLAVFMLGIGIIVNSNAKTLEFFNESNHEMSFEVGSACMNVVPSKFNLLPKTSKKVDLNVDRNIHCEPGAGKNYSSFTIIGSSISHNANGFKFNGAITETNWKDFNCSPDGDLKYCYYFKDNQYHPDYKIELDQNYIYIVNPT